MEITHGLTQSVAVSDSELYSDDSGSVSDEASTGGIRQKDAVTITDVRLSGP